LCLFITMETEKDLSKKIALTKTQIRLSQEAFDRIDEKLQQVWEEKIESIKHKNPQTKIIEMQLKIYELEEAQEKIRDEINIPKKALEEYLKKLEEVKRKSFLQRFLRQ